MAVEVMIKKWGNSMGVVLPREVVKQRHLKENDHVMIEVVKEADLRPIFGSLKMKLSGQELKNMARKGWQ